VKSEKETKEEKELDEFFAANKETSSEEGDLPSSAVASEKDPESPLRHGENSTEKLIGLQVHKNNLQDEMEIAESIICGIAQYSEMDVKSIEVKRKEEGKLVVKKQMLRLCLMRCFRPDCLMDEIKNFIDENLGPEFSGLPPFRFKEYIWPNTSRFKPVLVI